MDENLEELNEPFLIPSPKVKEPIYPSNDHVSAPRKINRSNLSNKSRNSSINEGGKSRISIKKTEKELMRFKRRKNSEYNPLDFMLNENSSKASKIATRLLFGETVEEDVPSEIFDLVILDLEHRRDVFMLKGAFDESVKAGDAIDSAKQLRINAAKKEAQKLELADVMIRKGHMKTDVSIFNHITKHEFHELKAKNEDKLARIKERQQRELEDHDRRWNDTSMLRKYNRRSKDLMDLRTLERRLMQAGRTEEAAITKKMADERERTEYEESRRQYDIDYKASRELLLQKHAEQLDTFYKSADVKKLSLKNKVANEKRVIANRKQALKHQEEIANDADKVWRLKHRGERDVVVRGARKEAKRDDGPTSAILLPPLEEKKSSRRK